MAISCISHLEKEKLHECSGESFTTEIAILHLVCGMYSETTYMSEQWDQGKDFHIEECSHLRGIFMMQKIHMGPGNSVPNRRFHCRSK